MSDDPDSDARRFREAMRGVRRLKRTDVRPPAVLRPPPGARATKADQLEMLRESLLPPADEALLDTGDELNFRRPQIAASVLARLRRGHFTVDAEIDLHGLTGAEAKAALREFLAEAVQRRMGCVRVIHGKGRRSGPGGPVLKNVVNQWMQRVDAILAFSSARSVDGGSGAVYVLLKKQGR